MQPAEVIHALWDRIQARDWSGAAELVADGAVIDWPVSSERIVGKANYIALNREYPEGWSIRVLRILRGGGTAALEVRYWPRGGYSTFVLDRQADGWQAVAIVPGGPLPIA